MVSCVYVRYGWLFVACLLFRFASIVSAFGFWLVCDFGLIVVWILLTLYVCLLRFTAGWFVIDCVLFVLLLLVVYYFGIVLFCCLTGFFEYLLFADCYVVFRGDCVRLFVYLRWFFVVEGCFVIVLLSVLLVFGFVCLVLVCL